MSKDVYVKVKDACGNPLGLGRVELWCQTTICIKTGGSDGDKFWPSEYGSAPCLVLDTGHGFKVIPLADQCGQATVTTIEKDEGW
jgi:hypothetical protein